MLLTIDNMAIDSLLIALSFFFFGCMKQHFDNLQSNSIQQDNLYNFSAFKISGCKI